MNVVFAALHESGRGTSRTFGNDSHTGPAAPSLHQRPDRWQHPTTCQSSSQTACTWLRRPQARQAHALAATGSSVVFLILVGERDGHQHAWFASQHLFEPRAPFARLKHDGAAADGMLRHTLAGNSGIPKRG
jgi:hypothetical protein